MFWRRKPKYKEIDEIMVDTIRYGLPGVNVKDLLPSDHVYGKDYFWGFVPNKRQPLPIVTILLQQMEEQERNSPT